MVNKYIPSYIWIKNHRSISNQGFHFTNEYKYSFNPNTNTLTRTKNDEYITDFYDENINITAIVGKNGAGKTTILSSIMECFDFDINYGASYSNGAEKNKVTRKELQIILAFSNGEVWVKYDNNTCYYFDFSEIETNKKELSEDIETESSEDIKTVSINLDDANKRHQFPSGKVPVTCIYYTQALDWSQFQNKKESIINLSTGNLLNNVKDAKNYYKTYAVRTYFVEEFIKQIRFVEDMQKDKDNKKEKDKEKEKDSEKDNEDDKDIVGFKLPDYITVKPTYFDHSKIVEKLTSYIMQIKKIDTPTQSKIINSISAKLCYDIHNHSADELHERFFKQQDRSFIETYFNSVVNEYAIIQTKSNSFAEQFKTYLTINLFCSLCDRFNNDKESPFNDLDLIFYLNEAAETDAFTSKTKWERLGILFQYIENRTIKRNALSEKLNIFKEFSDLKNLYDYFSNLLPKIDVTYSNTKNDFAFNISLTKNDSNITYPLGVEFKSFWENYKSVALFTDIFEFFWNLSSGEISRLELYARLYDIIISQSKNKSESNNKKQLYNKHNSVLLLIDEADMLLHPEWQRTFVNDIKTVFPRIFPGQYINVIIATHSPIMLSDIPKQNALFLKKEDSIREVEGCNTFASNIFQLFQDAFFISEAGIGAYAENKLRQIVEHIHAKNISAHEIEKLINSVGDAFLKNKLTEEYLTYHSQSDDADETQENQRITNLQNELEKSNAKIVDMQRRNKDAADKLEKQLNALDNHSDENSEAHINNEAILENIRSLLEEYLK